MKPCSRNERCLETLPRTDGVDAELTTNYQAYLRDAATRDAIVVLRSFSEPSTQTESNHPERDRSMLWGVVDIRSAQTSRQ